MKVIRFCAFYMILLAGIAVECHSYSRKFHDHSKDCREVHQVTKQELEEFDEGYFEPSNIHKKYKCYAHCLLQRGDYLDSIGKINMEKLLMREDIGEEQLDIITECKAEHDIEDDPCEYGFGIISCIVRVIESDE